MSDGKQSKPGMTKTGIALLGGMFAVPVVFGVLALSYILGWI